MQEDLSPEQQPQMEPQENISDSTMQAITHLALNGKDEKSTQWIKDNPYWAALTDTKHKEPGWQDYQIGHELSNKCGDGTPFSLLFNMRDTEQDEVKRQELDAKIMGCNTADAKRLLGSIVKERINKKYDEQQEALQLCLMQQNAAEMRQRAQDSPFLQSVIGDKPQEQTPQQRTASILEEVVNYGTDFAPPEQILHLQKAGLFKVAMGVHEALEAYKENPDDETTQGTVGAILRNTGNMALAMPMFQQAILPLEQKRYEQEGRKSLLEKGIDTIVGLADVLDTQENTRNQTAAYKVATERLGKSSMEDIMQVASHYGDDKNLVAQQIAGLRQQIESGDFTNQGGAWNNTYYALAAAIDIIPWLNPAGAAASFGKLAKETEAQSNAELMSDDYELSDSERLQSRWEAAYTAGATAGAMALTAGVSSHIVKSANAILPSTAVNAFTGVQASRLGSFALNTTSTGLTFATLFPAAQGTINAILDTTVDPRIRTGMQELDSLSKNLRDRNYWVQQLEIGSILGFMHSGQLSAKAKQRLKADTQARLIGLTEKQIAETTNLPEGKREEQRAIYAAENIKNDKENTILRSIESIKQNAKLYLQAQRKRDNATIAACRQYGFDIQPTEKNGTVRLYHDGKVDQEGNFNRGEKFIEMPEQDANAYVNGVVGRGIREAARVLRTAEANKRILDAAKKLKGKVSLETMRTPEVIEKVQNKAKLAQERKDKRVEELMNGEEKLSKSEAEKRAGQEIAKDINETETLDTIINFGKQMQERVDIERQRGNDVQDIQSRAYVLTREGLSPEAVERVFRIANDATTSEVMEEYAEQFRKDWMQDNGISVVQAYNMLRDLQANMGDKANFLTLSKRNADIHEKLSSTNFNEADLSRAESQSLAQEVTEALSRLLSSDLLQQVKSGKTSIPEWARSLFDGTDLIETELNNELALGQALSQARAEGWMPELMQKLLNVSQEAVEQAIADRAEPTPQEYSKSYMDALQRQAELDAKYGAGRTTDPQIINKQYSDNAEGQRQLDEQMQLQEEQASEPNNQIIKEAEQEPQNAGKPHAEIVKQVADNYNAAKQQQVQVDPATIKDKDFSGGNCIEITDSTGLLCKSGVLSTTALKILPNFKRGADAETGVVQGRELTGDYRADHDPIRVFRSKDGNLYVISGRHRLDKCKQAGVDKISAYVYDESEAINIDWAHRFDVESNIRDNQASVIECALYTRGELYDGGKPLTETAAIQAGLTRKGTQGNTGYEIGRKGSGQLIDALRNGQIDDREAFRIAQLAPQNPRVQNVGLTLRQQGESWPTVERAMHDVLDKQAREGGDGQMDMFGMLDSAEDVLRIGFEAKYKNKRIREINDELAYLNQVAGAKGSVKRNAKYDVNVKSPEQLKARIEELKVLKHQWENAQFYPELKQEIDRAYKGENLFTEQADADIARREQEAQAVQPEPATQDAGQSTFDFSTTAGRRKPKPWEELGQVATPSRFADQLGKHFSPVGFDLVDQRFIMMQRDIKRTLEQLASLGNTDSSTEKGFKLFTEGNAIVESVNRLLPNSYKMSLQPYKVFMDVYATLYNTGSARKAADRVPMAGWDAKMRRSFMDQFERAVENPASLRNAEYWKEFPEVENLIKELNALDPTKDIKSLARTNAAKDFFSALGNKGAQRLMDNYLTRAEKQLDKYRKDVCLGRIIRVVDSLTPQKNGSKPVKGKIAPRQYETVQDRVALMRLTKGEYDEVIQSYGVDENGEYNFDSLPDTTVIPVDIYNADGTVKTIKTNKQEFTTYACFDEMNAEQVEGVARALGTYIKEGREAWEVLKEQRKERIAQVCDPLIRAAYRELSNPVKQEAKDTNRLRPKRGNRIRAWIDNLMNDAQTLNAFAKEGTGMESIFKDWELRVAKAHVLIEQGEVDTQAELDKCVTQTLGTSDRSAWRKFYDDINAIRKSQIVLTPRPPDFAARATDTLRAQLLRRLAALSNTDRTNYDADGFAVVFQHLMKHARNMPPELVKEIKDKYGNIGNAANFKKDKAGRNAESLIEHVFGENTLKFLDFNASVKERAAQAEAKWLENHKLAPETEPLDLSKNIAAYRVLIWEQDQYKDSMRQQGYTEDTIQQLRDFAGEQMMDYAYRLRESLNSRTDTMAQIYESIYGMPFPKVQNYFRAFFKNYKQDNKNAIEMDSGNAANSGSLSIFKHRVNHAAPIEPSMAVTHAFANARKQQDLAIAYAKDGYGSKDGLTDYLPDEMNAYLNHELYGHKMREVVDKVFGRDSSTILQQHIDNMTKLSAEVDQSSKFWTRVVSLISNASAINILNFRVGSLVKQATALFNSVGSDAVSVSEWNMSLTRVLRGAGKISLADIAKDPALATRFKGWQFNADRAAALANADVKVSRGATSAASQAGMALMEWMDYKANITSSAVLYDAVYRKYQKQYGNTWGDAQLHQAAMAEVVRSLANKAQPMDFRSRALSSRKRDAARAALFFLGGETVNTFARVASILARGGKGSIRKASALWLSQGAALQALTFLYNFLTDDDDQWRKRSLAGYLAGTVLGPLSGVPFIGTLVNYAVVSPIKDTSWGKWLPYMQSADILPYANMDQIVRDWKKAAESGNIFDYSIAAENSLRILAMTAAAVNHNPTTKNAATAKAVAIAAAGAANVLDFFLRTTRANVQGEGYLERARGIADTAEAGIDLFAGEGDLSTRFDKALEAALPEKKKPAKKSTSKASKTTRIYKPKSRGTTLSKSRTLSSSRRRQ